ncbi:LIV-I protein F [Variovorax sp. PBL-H6]|uniref:ABC transporter ATP-binding protein n=1 Tax=Variovorax sp. PBL-H6 TaxID=434009 RepID=UPI001319ADBF|nr:ABC transporter ATP-binding protein [Variovorax sp. PBL-H6]VTU26681.1 LIV-I protein F [Variovorax sp. PBL-H6]
MSAAAAKAMLSVRNLGAGYSRGNQVLKGLSMELQAGRTLALMGRNGMGKTTLVRAIMGLVDVSAGDIEFSGRAIVGQPTHRISQAGIAYVPQGREIFPGFSVQENMRLGALSHAQREPDWERLYGYFPVLRERCNQPAQTLSGGQQQMLAIARALAARPSLLLLDEPSEGIQPSIVHEIALTLSRINREEQLTILLIEQNLEMVQWLADDVLFIENGREGERFTIEQLRGDPAIFERNMGL